MEDNNFSFLGFEDRRGRSLFVVGGGIGDVGRFPLIRREGGRGDEAAELAEANLVGEVLRSLLIGDLFTPITILVGEELLSLLIGDFTPITILDFGEVPRDLFCGRDSSGSGPMS